MARRLIDPTTVGYPQQDQQSVADLRKKCAAHLEPGMPAIACWGCGQRVRMDKRRLTAAMVWALWRLYQWDRYHPGEPMDYRNKKAKGEPRNHSLLRWSDEHIPNRELRGAWGGGWALIEPVEKHPGRGGKLWAGWWKITERGRLFITGGLRVPKAIYHYDNDCWGFTRGTIDAVGAAGTRFDLEALLRDNAPE